MNRATLIGRIGQNPEITVLDSGTKIAKFSLATNESYKNKAGERVQETDWHNIEVFGKLAEIADKFFEKGKQMLVEGRIKTDSWEKDGQKHFKTKIVMNNFEFIAGGESKPKQETHQAEVIEDEDYDDLPF